MGPGSGRWMRISSMVEKGTIVKGMTAKGTVVKGMAAKGTPVFPKVIPIGTSYEIQKTADISRSGLLVCFKQRQTRHLYCMFYEV